MITIKLQPLNMLKLTGAIFPNTNVGYQQAVRRCEKMMRLNFRQSLNFPNFLGFHNETSNYVYLSALGKLKMN